MKPLKSLFLFVTCLILAWLAGTVLFPRAASAAPPPQASCPLVVLSDTTDPYYPLAQEIAAAEKAPLFNDPASALACRPVFLLWVASPGHLSDEVMVAFGRAVMDQPSAVSSGLITGSNTESARALWRRRELANNRRLFAANAPNPAAHIPTGRLREITAGTSTDHPLSKNSLAEALQSAGYLTFTGHGASRYLRLDGDTQFSPGDVPDLNAVVVSTGSCESVKPWRQDSIALAFIDRGAAAYAGFVFSPNEGYLMGEFDGLPFRYTWPEFPIGHVVQAQVHGTLQGFARFPYHLLLGDPRINLQAEPAYRLVDEQRQGGLRTLTYSGLPTGVVPIRVTGGAGDHFVEAVGITAASDSDPFYNSDLQMVNIGADKYLLLQHPGGSLTLHLRSCAPNFWLAKDVILDSLDHTFLFSPQSGGDFIALAFSVIPLTWSIRLLVKKRAGRRAFYSALFFGLAAAALCAAYAYFRLDHLTIISKTVVFSPPGLAAAFLLSACSALIYTCARRFIEKAAALLVVTFLSWAPTLFGLLVLAGINWLYSRSQIGAGVYNYSLGLVSLPAFLLSLALAVLALPLLKKHAG